MYAELGACLGNGCLHVCGIGCMFGERLGACLGTVLSLSAELGACLAGPNGGQYIMYILKTPSGVTSAHP